MNRRRRSNTAAGLLAVALVAVLLSACTGRKNPTDNAAGRSEPAGENPPREKPGTRMQLRLTTGTAPDTAAEKLPVVAGTPLDQAAIDAVTSRLPAWSSAEEPAGSVNWPVETVSKPPAGRTIDTPFGTSLGPAPETPSGTALTVTRVQPTGAVSIAPFVSVSFNQPMVPLATVAQMQAAEVPATITPAVAGRWSWIGTQTLRFDASSEVIDRLPMATDYRVTVPAGTRSTSGATLDKAATFTFSTPAPTVQSFQPKGMDLTVDEVFVVSFDQRIDPVAMLDAISVRAGDKTQSVRLATDEEITASSRIDTGVLLDGRWLAFRTVDPLPANSAVQITVGPDAPSAEGPRTTRTAETFELRTFPPLTVRSAGCGDSVACLPSSPLVIVMSNPLDTDRFDPRTISVTPPLAGQSVIAYDNVISITGATRARTSYEVTLPADLTDSHGQTLGQARTETVTIGAAQQQLRPLTTPLTTLDPFMAKPALTIETVNHADLRVRIYDVAPTDWTAYINFVATLMNPNEVPAAPGTLLRDSTIAIAGDADQAVDTTVDLGADLGADGLGHLIVVVEPTETFAPTSQEYWNNRPTATWIQSTAIGVDAFRDNDELRVWSTDLRTGAPLTGVQIASTNPTTPLTGTTGADGVATVSLPPFSGDGMFGQDALLATKGPDSALLASGSLYGYPASDSASWYVANDRGTYRPGETVSIKGWVRQQHVAGDGQLHLIGDGSVAYQVMDAAGVQLAEGSATLNPLGGFDWTFVVPAGANLGQASLLITTNVPGVNAAPAWHPFSIAEYRRPEFEVKVQTFTPEPILSSAAATVSANAAYYAGGPLGAAPVTWQVSSAAGSYSPPGWDRYTFGVWTPWWQDGINAFSGSDRPCCGPFPSEARTIETFTGTTGADGRHVLQIDFAGADGGLPDLPQTVTATASVSDVNRQEWAGATTLLVHPAEYYVGLRATRTFVRQGEPLDIEAVITDIDGRAVAGQKTTITATRSEWAMLDGVWTERQIDPQTCEKTSATDPVRCSFDTTVGGTYKIVATVADEHGGINRSELTRWVTGGTGRPARNVEREDLTVVPDKDSYAPGEQISVLVQAPFATGHGIVTISRVGLQATQQFEVADGSAVVTIPVAETDVPNLDLFFEVVGAAARTGADGEALPGAPQRPAFATATLRATVSTASRVLTISAVPRQATLAPGGATQLDVTVTGPDGAAVAGAEFAVAVVDEAVLALSDYRFPDPLAVFYPPSYAYVDPQLGRSSIVLADPESLAPEAGVNESRSGSPTTAAGSSALSPPVPSGDGASSADASKAFEDSAGVPATPIGVRSNFDPLAVFNPSVLTDATGKAVIDVPLPDTATRYRVMVVAVSGADKFGSVESAITARLPLTVRPSAPRFLNYGDRMQVPVVVQNQTDEDMTVDVVMQSANLTLTAGAGRRVEVPSNDRIEVRFPADAGNPGTARLRVAAVSGAAADSATVELPIYTPSTTEAFATYGVIDDGAVSQPLDGPTGVIPQFGGLDITTSSTALSGLTDAVIYVLDYPHPSADGLASRVLTAAALRDVLDEFDAAEFPGTDAVLAKVAEDVTALAALQNSDGGFSYWQRGWPSDPFVSIEATQALLEASAAGIAVPAETIDAALRYLTDIEKTFTPEDPEAVRDTLSSYAMHVRALAGSRDPAKAQALFDRRGAQLSLEAVAWLWPILDDPTSRAAVATRIQNSAVETAGAANFTADYGDAAHLVLHSQRRTDGVILDALITQQPDSALIPKIVTGLLAQRSEGRWSGIQENTVILLALRRYFNTFESQTPDFVGRVWLGDRFAGEQSFVGRSTDRNNLAVAMTDVIAAGDSDILVAKEGTGRLYYRLGLRYAPDDLRSDPLDRGFVVSRGYEAVDDPADVTRDSSGVWHVKAGARVRVKLTVVAESQRSRVALIDAAPAGFEIVNPELAVSAPVPDDRSDDEKVGAVDHPYWYGPWYDHQNLLDDRAEAFATLLPAGTYDYSYVARATTPGSFIAPPTRAEELYAPETFGRSGSATVTVDA